jgi:type I restriction enzyme S subunit
MMANGRQTSWRRTKWGELASLEYGKSLRDYDDSKSAEKPVPVFGTNGPIGWHSSPLCNQPGIIVGRKGAYRGIHFSPEPFFVIDTAFYLRPKTEFNTQWAYYQLKHFDINKLDSGSAIPSTSREAFYEIPVSLPPLPVQCRIAGILSAYDGLIQNSRRRIRVLEAMARALYHEWFVRFRFPGHENRRRVSSALGDIPNGWQVMKLGKIVELHYGKALKKTERRGGEVPVYGSSGVIGTHNANLVKGPGIIVGRKGNVGTVFWSDGDFFVIDTAYFVTSTLPLRFLLHMLPTLNFINSDAAVPGLSRNQAYSIDILLPPIALLNQFSDLADTMGRQVSILHRQAQNLARTRDLLLPRLLSGQIEVDAD